MEQVADNHGVAIQDFCHQSLLPRLRILKPPKTFRDFYKFPQKTGWQVEKNFALEPYKGPNIIEELDKETFIQAWLFFGLISTIVQIDKRPILELSDLVDPNTLHQGQSLSTRGLHDAIERWTKWERANKESSRFRLIQVGWVLDLARQVIQKFSRDEDEAQRDVVVSRLCVLILMCLGETLSAAKARIVSLNGVNAAGWHGDDYVGWGPPRLVFDRMKKDNWCPRAIEILRGQVSSNATMLVTAYQAYRNSTRMTEKEHKTSHCTSQECKVKSIDNTGNYRNRHTDECENGNGRSCKPSGPIQDDIVRVLQNPQNCIPLLEFLSDESEVKELKFRVISLKPFEDIQKEFVTISHVWSDGWGNEKANELNNCQLRFIQRQIKRATNNFRTPFWMDTLVVPVADEHKVLRKKAIRQIVEVFDRASCTIILDNGLSSMAHGRRPAEAAMKIISSVWMRRLWTLQEAYFSRKILIPFEEDGVETYNLQSFDEIVAKLEEAVKSPKSGIMEMIRIQLSRMIMGEERLSRTRDGVNYIDGASSVANAYHAARWRTTGKAEHEVLALATLLQLKTTETIEGAGLDAPTDQGGLFDNKRLEDLVCEFWRVLQLQRKGSIPPGMIFLPGEKVKRVGFGWAPTTWLSVHEMDYPDPLSSRNEPSELDENLGLRVAYPGVFLYPNSQIDRARILGTSVSSDPPSFPIDRSLDEWYSFERVDDPATGQPNQVTRLVGEDTQLAIILSGPLPRESSKEIALLVEVKQLEDPDDEKAKEFRALIIHRVLIWKDPGYLKKEGDREQFQTGYAGLSSKPLVCLGETLPPTQRWWVDSPEIPETGDLQTYNQDFTRPPLKSSMTMAQAGKAVLASFSWLGFRKTAPKTISR